MSCVESLGIHVVGDICDGSPRVAHAAATCVSMDGYSEGSGCYLLYQG